MFMLFNPEGVPVARSHDERSLRSYGRLHFGDKATVNPVTSRTDYLAKCAKEYDDMLAAVPDLVVFRVD